MADGTVDSLNIQLSADADKAVRALNNLSSSLKAINSAFSKDVSGMRKFSKEIGTLSASIKSIANIPDISGITRTLNSLNNIRSGDLQKTADGINRVLNSFSQISASNLNDSGINKTVNALNRLFKVDMSRFDPSDFSRITDSISKLGSMPDVSNSINRFVSSLSRLASAGEKTGQSANSVFRLGQEVRKAAQEFQNIGNINDDINMFVQSIAKLASAGGKTSQTAAGLKSLAQETLKFFNTMSKAPRISKNTIQMTQALAQLASAGGRVSTSTGKISTAFSKLASIGNKTLSAMKKIASGITSAFRQIGTSSKQVNSARFSLWSLLKTAIGFRLGYGLLQFGQQAFELGSAITEVENVVDVAFGSMADKAYEFASTATEQFGLSELAAKQYSGTMMAMLNSTGVAQDAAAEMSTTLAGLAGDLASFYNISTDEAFMKLRSAIAGETEPMRQLGINMTVAALQSYALSQGIDKSWQSMTQAEQAMLRYNYIMSATSQQQGDFQRTVGSFANQWRLLTLNVQQFSAVVGQGLIAAVLPAIQAINALFSVLMRAAEAFRNFMYVLTGYKGQGSQGGIVNEMAGIGDVSTGLEDVGTAGGDASSGMDDATDSAKDLKKALSVLSFDELNQLSSSAEDLGDALGGAGGGGGGLDDINVPGTELGGFDDMIDALGKSKLPEAVNEWAERLRAAFLDHDWDRLGKEIAWGINKGLQAIYDVINWDNAKKKIVPFVYGFTQTFNSLVDAVDWDLLGRTVGAGINTIVNSANLLMEGIDWVNLGRKFSEGINGILNEVDWNNFGRMLGNYFMISWEIFAGFVEDLNFAKIGRSVAEGLNSAFSEISFMDIAHALATALNGAFDSLAAFAVNFNWGGLVRNIVNGISTFIRDFEWTTNALKLTTFLNKLMNALADLAADIPWGDVGKNIGEFIGTALGSFDWDALGNFLNKFISGLCEALRSFATTENFMRLGEGIATAIAGIPWMDVLGTAVGLIKDAIVGLLSGIWSNENASIIEKALTSLVTSAAILVLGSKIPVIGKLGTQIVSWLTQKLVATEAVSKISGAFSTLLSGATTGAGNFAKALAPLVGEAGLIVGVGVAATVALDGLRDFVETLQGGNGVASAFGASIDSYLNILSEKGWIAGDTATKLFQLKESLESGNMSADEMKDATNQLMTELSNSGVTADQARYAFDLLRGQYQMSDEMIEALTLAIDGMTDSMSNSTVTIPNTQAAYSALEENVRLLINQFHLAPGALGTLQTALINTDGSAKTAQEAFDSVILVLESMGVNTEEAAEYLAKLIPGAVTEVDKSVSKHMTNADNTVAQKSQSMKNNVKSTTSEMARSAESDFSNIESDAENYFAGVNDTTVLNWGNSAEEVKLNLRAMKLAASEQLSAMTETVRSYSQSMYNIFTGKFEDIAEQIKREINSMDSSVGSSMRNMLSGMQNDVRVYVNRIANEFSGLSRRISNNMQGMYNVGRNAAVQFANGIRSVHIPMPHITVDSSTWNNGSGYSYRMNSSVQWYKKGGLFMQPSVIGLAEAGKEAVLPLENRRTMSMIADSIMGNATTGMSEETLVNAVTAGVTMAMMNNQGNQTPINLYATLYTEDNEVLARAVAKGQESIDYRYNPTPQFG